MHEHTSSRHKAVLYKWKPGELDNPYGYGFAKLSFNNESIYVPGSTLRRDIGFNNIQEGMTLTILQIDPPPPDKPSRVASSVQVKAVD